MQAISLNLSNWNFQGCSQEFIVPHTILLKLVKRLWTGATAPVARLYINHDQYRSQLHYIQRSCWAETRWSRENSSAYQLKVVTKAVFNRSKSTRVRWLQTLDEFLLLCTRKAMPSWDIQQWIWRGAPASTLTLDFLTQWHIKMIVGKTLRAGP